MKNEIEKALTKDWQGTRDIYNKVIKKTDEYSIQLLRKILNKMYKYQEIDRITGHKGRHKYVYRLR